MNLFELKSDQVTFSPQALMLEPFNNLWKRDKSKGKSVANAELAAVYFYTDYKSDFAEIMNEEEKLSIIKSVIVGMDKSWKPDKLFTEACEYYRARMETPATLLLEDVRVTVANVRKFLRNIQMEDVDDNGKPIHNIKQIIDSLGAIHKVTESLFELEEQVKKERRQIKDSLKGGREKAIFEDGVPD